VIISYPDIIRLMSDLSVSERIRANIKHRIVKGNIVYTTNSILGVNNKTPCVFLKENKCSVHSIKPLICKTYPFSIAPHNSKTSNPVKVIQTRRAPTGELFDLVIIDLTCPGLGRGDKVDLEHLFDICFEEYLYHTESYP